MTPGSAASPAPATRSLPPEGRHDATRATATVPFARQHLDELLAERKVELVFNPFDLTEIEVSS
jgi:hypothetical protein